MEEAASTTFQPARHVDRLRQQVNEALDDLVTEEHPADLYDPVRYVLASKGKRVRPLLVLLAAELYGVPNERALPAALAVETFHNFTLVHDDIMDNADSRRGRASVHVEWDEATAILCGDYLMSLSYDLMARTEGAPLMRLMQPFNRMVQHLCEGQALDKEFEERGRVSVAEYMDMIDRKTAALIQTALELGGVLGKGSEDEIAHLRDVGRQVGRAFQIQDDLLDLVADHDRWGKQIGGDLIEGKKTFLLLHMLERAEGDRYDWFYRIVEEGGLPADEVGEARSHMEQLGVLADAEQAVSTHSSSARAHLDALPEGPARTTLRWLIDRMEARLH